MLSEEIEQDLRGKQDLIKTESFIRNQKEKKVVVKEEPKPKQEGETFFFIVHDSHSNKVSKF